MLKTWLEDTVHSVRVEAVNSLIKLKNNSFDQHWLQ
jgi:hypothetical protein